MDFPESAIILGGDFNSYYPTLDQSNSANNRRYRRNSYTWLTYSRTWWWCLKISNCKRIHLYYSSYHRSFSDTNYVLTSNSWIYDPDIHPIIILDHEPISFNLLKPNSNPPLGHDSTYLSKRHRIQQSLSEGDFYWTGQKYHLYSLSHSLFLMSNKSPGSDDYPAELYKPFWQLIAQSIISMTT